MIHHLSIAARDPKHVAGVLAEFMGGVSVPFPPNPGSFFALQLDEHGSGVEVYPAGTQLQPGGSDGGVLSRSRRPGAATGRPISRSVSPPKRMPSKRSPAERVGSATAATAAPST